MACLLDRLAQRDARIVQSSNSTASASVFRKSIGSQSPYDEPAASTLYPSESATAGTLPPAKRPTCCAMKDFYECEGAVCRGTGLYRESVRNTWEYL